MKAFIIHLPYREFSNTHSRVMLKQLRDYGFDAELFEGTEGQEADDKFRQHDRQLWPYSIKTNQLSKEEIEDVLAPFVPGDFFVHYDVSMLHKIPWDEHDLTKALRPGVKGCFDSHYRLWKHCISLNETIAIFEDDVKFYRNFVDIDFDDVLIVSTGKQVYQTEPFAKYLDAPESTPRPMIWKNYSMPGTSGYIIHPHAARSLVKTYRQWYLPADNAINKSIVNIQIHNYLMGRHMHESEGNVSAL